MVTKYFWGFLITAILTGCQSQPGLSSSTPAALTPYATHTGITAATITPPPTQVPPAVTPLPTQITHTIAKGEDMGGIATRYEVKIKDLREANPDIDPRMIPVGTVLIIPSGNPEQDAYQPTAIPTPAILLQTGAPVCYPDAAGGAWCLVDVMNNTGAPVEDISVDFFLTGANDLEPQSRTAFGLLNRLPDQTAFPVAVYFPSPPAQPRQVNIRLRTAFPVLQEDERYLESSLANPVTQISANASSAKVQGAVALNDGQSDANFIWVAAAIYNADGQPVGVRRWESPVGLESGSGLVYDFNVFSLDGPISRVEVRAETRP